MKWSPQQDAALLAVAAWLADPNSPQVFRLFGFAGTGKTTLAQHFAEGVSGIVLYAALTGKAAHVLIQKGCLAATTIHSLIYHTKEKGRSRLKDLEQSLAQLRIELQQELEIEQKENPDANLTPVEEHRRVGELRAMVDNERKSLSRPIFTLNQESAVKEADLIIIDEVSMVDGQLGEDLLSFGTKVLVLGDPAQLPPVAGSGFFTHGFEPDVMLTDIHRQAAESPIIAMATQVRQERALSLGWYGESRVILSDDIEENMAKDADQILVGRNATRHASNRRMRQLLGYTEALPIGGDKLVCLRNNHDKGLLNGALWEVVDVGHITTDLIYMSLIPEDVAGEQLDVEVHTHHFLGRSGDLPWWDRMEAEEFDYGYALTVHKAQGSQWDRTLLFDESFCFRKDRWRWLYTGLTRAAEVVTVVKV